MCALVNKARNVVVNITLKSGGKSFLGRIVDFDDRFLEVQVKLDPKSGEYSVNREHFENGSKIPGDRILVALDDISIIA